MAKFVLLDELQITLRIPNDLSDEQIEAIRQTLASADFVKRLRQALRATMGNFPELAAVRVSLSR